MRAAIALLVLAGCWRGTTAPEPTPAPETVVEQPAEPDEPCRGSHLTIADVQKHCSGQRAQPLIPPAVQITLDPPTLTIDGGTMRDVAIVLTNTSREDALVALDDSCGEASEVHTMIIDSNGDRVDTTGPQCGGGRGCSSSSVVFTLRPAGSLRIPFFVDARLLTFDASCDEQRIGAVAPGTYRLSASSTIKAFDVPITVY